MQRLICILLQTKEFCSVRRPLIFTITLVNFMILATGHEPNVRALFSTDVELRLGPYLLDVSISAIS